MNLPGTGQHRFDDDNDDDDDDIDDDDDDGDDDDNADDDEDFPVNRNRNSDNSITPSADVLTLHSFNSPPVFSMHCFSSTFPR